jgi:hypothetical protein
MIRLTLLYNLPDTTDEAEFLRWRLGDHQEENAAMEGVTRTDFSRIVDQWTTENPHAAAPYKFMTIVEYADRESFEKSFYGESPESMAASLALMKDPMFLVCEVLVETKNG